MTRRLSLSRETLAELTADDLADVNGGAATLGCPTLPLNYCLTILTCEPPCHTEV